MAETANGNGIVIYSMTNILFIMSIKRNFVATVLDFDRMPELNTILKRHADMIMQSSSHLYFNTQPINPGEMVFDITFFQLSGENEKEFDEKLNKLIGELDQMDSDYAIRNEDTGEMVAYVEFVGVLTIKFDNIEIIEKGTYAKIDGLKSIKTEFGVCKGSKPNLRPTEANSIKDLHVPPEKIILLCHSRDDLFRLRDCLCERIMEINSAFEMEFTQFSGDKPEFLTMNQKK